MIQRMTKIHMKDLKNEISIGRGSLKTAHINVNGILTKSKIDEIRLLLRTTGLDILGITESKLTSNDKDEDLEIAGYKFIRRDRPCEDGGGGCLLYYMEDMHLAENPNFLSHDIENLKAIWVDIVIHKGLPNQLCIVHQQICHSMIL